ncbi:hypothetical protein ElyMa_006184000 [Elysia marginata]|uniref:Uncharacterized protein n=1 Tax=Elysia marginata TaxID=1093978 RepID=A0AAV4H2L7_9GAST|nr:hypothetical protein ElyMa_006184000 [Elysia marginata]
MLIQGIAPIEFQAAKVITRRHILEHVWGPGNIHEKFPEGVRPPLLRNKEKGLSRREARAGATPKCPLLKSYLHAIGAALMTPAMHAATHPMT